MTAHPDVENPMRLSDQQFGEEREQLARQALRWSIPMPELDETVEYLRLAVRTRPSVAKTFAGAGRLLVQPRSGVSDHARMLDLLRCLGHADIGTLTIDSYTRLCLFDRARNERDLNGYPLVTRGLGSGRELVESVGIPLEVRHGSPDGRLLAEISFGSGITSFEGGGISYNLPYCKQVPLADSLRHWRYVDRLSGLLTDRAGVKLDRETFGTLTAVLVPPSISITVSILEALLAAEQGVRCLTLSYPESGCLPQDVAALQVMPELCREHLQAAGVAPAVEVHTAFHQWMGVFPADPDQARRLIGFGVVAAVAGGATKLINKTYEEARGLPSPSANAWSIRYCQELARFCANRPEMLAAVRQAAEVAEERDRIRQEVNEILEAVYELGTNDLAASVVRAFAAGLLDIPFPASRFAHGRVMPGRDVRGAIRYRSHGRLPFSTATVERHRRDMGDPRACSYRGIIADINWMARGGNLHADPVRLALLEEFRQSHSRPTERSCFC
jgi:methylaspartate mutase epsilon subunit